MTAKTCRACGETKPLEDFPPDPRRVSGMGRAASCRKCHAGRQRASRERARKERIERDAIAKCRTILEALGVGAEDLR